MADGAKASKISGGRGATVLDGDAAVALATKKRGPNKHPRAATPPPAAKRKKRVPSHV